MQSLAPQGQEFFLHDGRRLRSKRDLYEALGEMTDEEFSRFVTPEKNDFAMWIEHSLDERFLAAAARRAHTRLRLRKILFISLHV